MPKIVKSAYSRVFTIEGGAGPTTSAEYQGLAKPMGATQDFGSQTPIRAPGSRYGGFDTIDTVEGDVGLPATGLQARYRYTRDEFLRIAKAGCLLDVQVHFGSCQDPKDFNGGWDKILVYEGAKITSWGTGELGALDFGENAVVNVDIGLQAREMYEIVPISVGEIAAAETVQEVVAVVICDSIVCAACGVPSNGCDKVFALTLSAGGSPGLAAEVIFSGDGGSTFGDTNITTLAANEDPDDAKCVGTNLVVVSQDSGSYHYAPIADILAAAETWVEVTTGFTAPTGSPRALFSLSSTQTWIVGAGGYIYFMDNVADGVTAQSSGGATAQDLNSVHAYDDLNVVAVGASNAVVRSQNGGISWTAITGPAVGVALNTVFMKTSIEWFVGAANGKLFYTADGGATWTEKLFAGSGTGSVRDIQFPTPTVGYMAHNTTAPAGRILRSIDGGSSWYVLPEGAGSIPTNDYIGSIGVCEEDPNVFYAGGLAGNAIDGIVVKAA